MGKKEKGGGRDKVKGGEQYNRLGHGTFGLVGANVVMRFSVRVESMQGDNVFPDQCGHDLRAEANQCDFFFCDLAT